jgi:hypothetical protein
MADIDRHVAFQFLMEEWERISVDMLRWAWMIYTEDSEDRD